MKKHVQRNTIILAAVGALFAVAAPEPAYAASNQAALRKGAGKYKGSFKGSAMAFGNSVPLNGSGFVKLPVGKGKGSFSITSNIQTIKLKVRIKKATVKQGGKKVVYTGRISIPSSFTQGFGNISGSYRGTATLKGKPKIKATTSMSGPSGISVKGTFKGKK